jgi:hypothetical protein
VKREYLTEQRSFNMRRIQIFFTVLLGFALITACSHDPELTANAGSNQTVTLSNTLTVTLNGSASSGSIASYAWECASYTADKGAVVTLYTAAQVTGMLSSANAASATVALRKAGTYVFKLTVTDNNGAKGTGNVTVTVEPQVLTKAGYSIPSISGVTNAVPSFSFTQVYNPPPGGWDTDFPSAALTYTLTAEGTSVSDTATSVSAVGRANGKYLVTQTFRYNGVPIQNGSRILVLEVSSNNFVASYVNKTDYNPWDAPVPTLNNLTLSKSITELP